MGKYNFKITMERFYYGTPQLVRVLRIDGEYLLGEITYYGNQGFDALNVRPKSRKNNGYFWSMQSLMQDIYDRHKGTIRKSFSLKEGESTDITIED